MFLAIINDTYGEVKSELAAKKDEDYQVFDFLKKVTVQYLCSNYLNDVIFCCSALFGHVLE